MLQIYFPQNGLHTYENQNDFDNILKLSELFMFELMKLTILLVGVVYSEALFAKAKIT